MADVSLIFGETGSRKTTALGHAAQYLYEATGKPGRAIYSDGGGWKPNEGLAAAGFFQVYNILGEHDIPAILTRLAEGYWPVYLDPETGLRIKSKPYEWISPDKGLPLVGFYLWEGLATSGDLAMKYMRVGNDNKGVPMQGELNSPFVVKDIFAPTKNATTGKEMPSTITFSANSQSHFGWVGAFLMDILGKFRGLAVPHVLISSHENAGEDEETGEPIRGPGVVGKKATARVGRNVGDCIHFDRIFGAATNGLIPSEVRCYFVDHPDPKFPKVSYRCKSRVNDQLIPRLMAKFPKGYFEPNQLGDYLALSDALVAEATDLARKRKAEIDAALAVRAGK